MPVTYKLDRTPVIGEPPDFERLRQIGKEGVIALIVESTYVDMKGRAPSERIARDLVRDTITSYEDDKNAIHRSPRSPPISPVSRRSPNVPTRSAGNPSSSGGRWSGTARPPSR